MPHVAALQVACCVALIVAKQVRRASVSTRLLALLEAISLIPLALVVEASFVAVTVTDPIRVAMRLKRWRMVRGWKMGGWEMEDEGWEDGGWEDGGWEMEDGGWRMGGWRMEDGR